MTAVLLLHYCITHYVTGSNLSRPACDKNHSAALGVNTPPYVLTLAGVTALTLVSTRSHLTWRLHAGDLSW
jgi:hypothetical protein